MIALINIKYNVILSSESLRHFSDLSKAFENAIEVNNLKSFVSESGDLSTKTDPIVSKNTHVVSPVESSPVIENSSITNNDVEFIVPYSSDSSSLSPVLPISKAIVSDLYSDPKNSQSYFSNFYLNKYQLLDKPSFPKEDFNFIKTQGSIKYLNLNKDYIFAVWPAWTWFYSTIFNSHLVFFKELQPISSYYLIGLDFMIRNSDSVKKNQTTDPGVFVNSLLFSTICCKVPCFIGSSVYGLSLSASDLLIFIPPKYKKLHFTAFINNDLQESGIKLILSNLNSNSDIAPYISSESIYNNNENSNEFLATMDVNSISKMNNLSFKHDNNRSPFVNNSFNSLFNQLYKFVKTDPLKVGINVSISYTQESVATRSASTARDESGKFASYLGGFSTTNVNTSNVNFQLGDHYITKIILALFHLDSLNLNEVQKSDILRYITSVITIYFLNQVINGQNITLLSVNINFEIEFNQSINMDFNQSRDLYLQYVRTGQFYPMTPLHYAMYLDPNFNHNMWFKFMTYSSLLVPSLSTSLFSVMPYIDAQSKLNFYEYCNSREMLNSSYYSSTWNFIPYASASLSFDQFMIELAVRNYLFDDFESPIPLLTRGKWNGMSGSSLPINIPKMNSYFVKFNKLDKKLLDEYLLDLVTKDSNKRPKFIKGSFRCFEKLPNVMLRLVSSVEPVDESGYDSDIVKCENINDNEND